MALDAGTPTPKKATLPEAHRFTARRYLGPVISTYESTWAKCGWIYSSACSAYRIRLCAAPERGYVLQTGLTGLAQPAQRIPSGFRSSVLSYS